MRLTRPALNTFTGTLHASAQVRGSAEQVYAVLRDPDFVGASTPFIRRVVVLGDDLWRWEVAGIRYPGGTFAAALTQRMEFDPPRLVFFRHAPVGIEPAGADGTFTLTTLTPVDEAAHHRGARAGAGGDRVQLDLEVRVHARIPAPTAAAPVVEAAMHVVLGLMRERFVRSLEHRLAER